MKHTHPCSKCMWHRPSTAINSTYLDTRRYNLEGIADDRGAQRLGIPHLSGCRLDPGRSIAGGH